MLEAVGVLDYVKYIMSNERLVERLLEVGQEILDILDADG